MASLLKNVASQVIPFALVNATTGAALTGATVTVKVALDGTQAAGGGVVTELGSGQYKYVPSQAETNGVSVGVLFTATNAVPVGFTFYPDVSGFSGAVNANVVGLHGNPLFGYSS